MYRIGGLCSIWLTLCAALSAQPEYAPQPESTLPRLLDIAWNRGPDLPQGFQDSNGGVISGHLITTCGFCAGRDNDKKPGKYPRGFLKKTWALDLANEAAGWKDLPEFPGAARQGLVGVPVHDALYCWGGFSYSAPFCYADGFRLSRLGDAWTWSPLPELPWPLCGAMSCAIGTTIYLCGGADYDSERFYTRVDRTGGCARMGARLLAFDTANAKAGWRRLPDCPGTPRWVAAMAAVQGKLHLIGGATGDPYCTVVDNWVFDPAKAAWKRLRDLPVATGNFPAGSIAFRDRYILLGGGHQYGAVANPDGSTRPPYGTAGRFQDRGDYHNDVFVYDVESDRFGRADSLPLNNNLSMMLVHGDTLYLLGGETGGALVECVFYGHHPELVLKGHITVPATR